MFSVSLHTDKGQSNPKVLCRPAALVNQGALQTQGCPSKNCLLVPRVSDCWCMHVLLLLAFLKGQMTYQLKDSGCHAA